ncbi:MAG: hypothetical protein NXI31_25200 [bacterium]|nr:hypothetical protein [bacterium]
MTVTAAAPRPGRGICETLVLAGLALLFYGVTFQAALHGTDWRWFVLWFEEPGAVHPQHPGYLVAAHGLALVLAPFGLSTFGLLQVLSVLGGAVAVAGCHRAALALTGRAGDARGVALIAMFCPALWHHATVVELHAPFFAVVAWAAVPVVRWAQGRGVGTAVAAGLLTGLAACMHATGQLVVVIVAVTLWHCGRARGNGRLAREFVAFVASHAVAFGAFFGIVRALGNLPAAVERFAAMPDSLAAPDNPIDYLLRWFRDMDFAAQIGPTVLNEWLEPFAPLAVLVLAGLFVSRLRSAVLWLHVLLAMYLVVTVALVHAWTDERGAYLLPLLLPVTLICWHALRSPPLRFGLVALTLVAGLWFRGEPGRLPPDDAFGSAAVAMHRERPTFFFVADFPEMDGGLRADPRLPLEVGRKAYDELLAAQGQVAGFEPTPLHVVGWLSLLVAREQQAGRRFVITDRAIEWMTARVPVFGAGLELFERQSGARRLSPATGIAGLVVEP